MTTMLRTALLLSILVALPAGVFAQSFSLNPESSRGAIPIPDNDPTGAVEVFPVSAPGMMILAVGDAPLDATHTWVGDLTWTIESPMGTVVTVIDRPGYTGTGFGCDGDDILANINDAGTAGPVEDMCFDLPAIRDDPTPNEPLASFVGEDPNGNWTLTITDSAAGDTGTMNSWNLFWTLGPIVANEPGAEQMPDGYLLESAYPNPFNPSATIGFAVADAQDVDMGLYDALGRRVRDLYAGTVGANTRTEVTINADGLPSGLYLVRLNGESFSTTRQVTLLK